MSLSSTSGSAPKKSSLASAKSGWLSQELRLWEKVLFVLAFAAAFLFFSHPDLWETANHSYVFLQSLFSGRIGDFYEVVAEHQNTYYYINNANYNIFIYLIFGLWELPVFVFNALFKLALNETFLIYWAKLLCAGFFVGCGWLLRRLCLNLGMEKNTAAAAALFFLLNPIAFFSPMVMGQYDTLCLFFTLWALCFYVQGRYTPFSLVLGLGAVCKFFPLLLFIPLILLVEKRLLHLLKYAVMVLWLYLPTTLLYWGRTGDAPVFTQAMIDRMFKLTTETGIRAVSVFTLGYAVLVFAAFLCTPKNEARKNDVALYFCLAAYSLLFLCIYWHPQWVILLVPFLLVTTLRQKHRAPWFWADVVLAAGFFLNCFYEYPNQTGAVLLDGGLLHHVFGQGIAACGENWQLLSTLLAKIPYVWVLTPVLFCGGILVNLIFKLPLAGGSPADRLCTENRFDPFSLRVYRWGIFALGFGCVFLLPVLLEAVNALAGLHLF